MVFLRIFNILEIEKQLLTFYPFDIPEITGHTCALGEENYNLMLPKARSQVVLNFLTDHGISKTRLYAQGYGESRPIATNETLEGRSKNRRIEMGIR